MLYYLWEYKNNVLLYVSVCICLHFFTYVLWSVHEIVKLLIHGHSEKLTHLINKNILTCKSQVKLSCLTVQKADTKISEDTQLANKIFLPKKGNFTNSFFAHVITRNDFQTCLKHFLSCSNTLRFFTKNRRPDSLINMEIIQVQIERKSCKPTICYDFCFISY